MQARKKITMKSDVMISLRKRAPDSLTILPITLAMTLSLAACGGGGSSSGSDDETNYAGTYEGGGDTDFVVGENTINDYTPTKIIVRPEGNVEASDGSANVQTSGTMNGDQYQASGTFEFNANGITCDMSINYSGSIKPDNGIATATGKVTGSGQCNGEPSSLNGVYTARKISDIAKSPVNSGFEQKFSSLKQP